MNRHPEGDSTETASVLGVRGLAFVIDVAVYVAVIALMTVLIGLAAVVGVVDHPQQAGAVFGFFAGLPLFVGYFVVQEGYFGRTLGKWFFDLVVTRDDNRRLDWRGAVVRNVLLILDDFPVAYLLGIVISMRNGRDKRLGDIVAGTVVVHEAE